MKILDVWADGRNNLACLTALALMVPGIATRADTTEGAAAIAKPQAGAIAPAQRMKLISRGVPVFASSGNAHEATSGEYHNGWRSAGVPVNLAFDLSSVPAIHRQALYLVWYNEASYPYDHGMAGGPGYDNLGSYTIEVNAAPGGGSPPSSGWQQVDAVAHNTAHSRDHLVKFSGDNWIRINATATDGTTQNYDVAADVDIYDASNGVNDGWFFFGDSIAANCMGHSGNPANNFINRVGAKTGVFPAEQNAGMPFWTSADGLKRLPTMLESFHGLYVTIALGTNDAAGNADPEAFYSNMEKIVEVVLAAGKIPVVPTIPWSRDAVHARSIPALNAQIRKLYQKNPRVVPGADLYELFFQHQDYISPDNVHPSKEGCWAMRESWADAAIASLYAAH